ncbi:hypothetical protein EGR_10253 [Echinococcus granulosus]|uniref:Uncharacterized protein n=1 Tax=Echinococcus granulosus TaxID=6210 RepID=W6U8R3_ECHGR|nr:hypothetical protein EGR_10253 [Echinococcus granulosus]EUB54892.1 hypothetical protein EGR_10253 [Echinococcus granulosus]
MKVLPWCWVAFNIKNSCSGDADVFTDTERSTLRATGTCSGSTVGYISLAENTEHAFSLSAKLEESVGRLLRLLNGLISERGRIA